MTASTDAQRVRFWPRKDELTAVTAILSDDRYPDEAAMADAVLKTAYSLFLRRDWFVTILGNLGAPSCWGYGLSSTEGEASKLALVHPARVIKITSAETLRKQL